MREWLVVMESVFPSGSLNHATLSPFGVVHTPWVSWSTPSYRLTVNPPWDRSAISLLMSATSQPRIVNGCGVSACTPAPGLSREPWA